MNTHEWMQRIRIWLNGLGTPRLSGAGGESGRDGMTLLRGLTGHSPEMADVQEQVASERQARIALASRSNDLLCWLLGALREQEAPVQAQGITHEGFFTLVTLPDLTDWQGMHEGDAYGLQAAQSWAQAEVADALQGVDMIVYLAEDVYPTLYGWPSADDRWYARLRSSPAPVLPVLVGAAPGGDASPAPGAAVQDRLESLRRHLGVKPLYLLRGPGHADQDLKDPTFDELVNRVLELRPRLATALAQEVPACRQLIAQRVIRSAAFMAALLGMEPLPLIDLPLTVLVQWKMALQIAAIHGRPGIEVFGREMAGAIGLNLFVRIVAQQALKLLPVFGWLLSSALNFSTTWLLGQALLQFYAPQPRLSVQLRLGGLEEKLPRSLRLPAPRRRKGKEDV